MSLHRKALCALFVQFDEWMCDGNFEAADAYMARADLTAMSEVLLIGLMTAGYTGKRKLAAWAPTLERVKVELQSRTGPDIAACLQHLKDLEEHDFAG